MPKVLTVVGLRTLCLSYRILSEELFADWSTRYSKVAVTVFDDPNARTAALDVLHDEIESDLMLLGATAIEDRLQDGVPECIQVLSQAGIKIWVLTGDKVETAVNVGFLCGLLQNTKEVEEGGDVSNQSMVLIQVKNVQNIEDVTRQLQRAIARFFPPPPEESALPNSTRTTLTQDPVKHHDRHFLNGSNGKSTAPFKQEFALIIDGQALKYALENETTKELLLNLGCRCKSVICCRVSPLQKAKVVEMVRRGRNVLSLAIGDGANDVSMIQVCFWRWPSTKY